MHWRAAGLAKASIVLMLAPALLASGCTAQDEASGPGSDTRSETAEPAPVATVAVDPVAKVKVGEAPQDALAAYGAMWIVNHRGNSVSRIDPKNNEVTATIQAKGDLIGIAASGGFLFTLDWENGEVVRIDARTNEIVSRVDVGLEGGTWATFDGSVWFGSAKGDDGLLLGFDPASGRIVRRFRYPGQGFVTVGVAADRLWAGTTSLAVVDTKTGELGQEVDLAGQEVSDTAEYQGDIWVSHPDSSALTIVDPESLQTRTLEVDAVVIGPTAIEPVPGGVAWRLAARRVALISDPEEEPTFYEGFPEQGYPVGLTWGFRSLWVVNWSTNDVWRVDLEAL